MTNKKITIILMSKIFSRLCRQVVICGTIQWVSDLVGQFAPSFSVFLSLSYIMTNGSKYTIYFLSLW